MVVATPPVSPFAVLHRADPGHDDTSAAGITEVDVALWVDELLMPDTDTAATREQLAQLCAANTSPLEPWRYLQGLGFAGNRDNYTDRANSSLSWVLEHRCGIPISLAVVLMAAARQAGSIAQGVNNPGHFLVRIDSVYVDPFTMAPLTTAQGSETQPAVSAAETSVAQFALRMLNNLKYSYAGESQWHRALEILEHQRAIEPHAIPLLLERAEYWERLGAPDRALEIYTALLPRLQSAQATQALQRVEEHVRRLQGAAPVTWN